MIWIQGLHKFFGENEVLGGIDLDIPPGQIIGYIGPNGAGKSTTVKILCGIITEYVGDIKVFDMDLKKHSLEIKRRIGYVPENGALYDLLTPNEYLHFIGTLYGIEEDNLKERIHHLMSFFGMDENTDQRMDTFSKGMKQKILIIAGIINNPDILFLDEPLMGLDANSVILIKEMLARMATEGKTIFFCSHLMDVVEKIAHRIILINEGNVIADGTFDELKTEKAETLERLFADLTGNQDKGFNPDTFSKAFEEK